ncbi:hypothetical protein M9Y10_041043 [Tritrichomonas musculus]|uniref:Exportin(tRNA) n=1 Tax=Tritrichomonas musculus TaxID=1915356 RepID=A0ABR2K3A9_9EUKA
MDQVKQIEQQVSVAFGSSDQQVSPQIKEEAQNNITQIYQKIDMIGFCISNYQNFEIITSKVFTLNLILFWMKEKYQDLSQEHIQVIQQFLFSPIFFSNYNELPDQIVIQLMSSQSLLITKIFPNPWASFFTDLVFIDPNAENYNDAYVKNFLIFFCNDINAYSPTNFTQISNLRSSLHQAGISSQIIEYLIVKCQNNEPVGYQILANAITLCPEQMFFENENLRLVIQAGLSNKNFVIFTFEALKKIISRKMEPTLKAQLLTQYVNPSDIFNVAKTSENQEIIVSSANLINKSLIIWQALDMPIENPSGNLGAQYFMLNINFIQFSEFSSSQVIFSVYNYMSKHADVVSETIKQLLDRITANFMEPNAIDDCQLTFQNAERYLNVIINVLQINSSIIQVIESYAPSFNFAQNPGICSMLIFVISHAFPRVLPKVEYQERAINYLNLFLTIFNNPPPFSPQQIICLLNFQIFATSQPSLVNKDILSSITSIMVNIVMMPGISKSFCKFTINHLPVFNFYLSKQRIIQIESQFLDAFIQSNNSDFVGAASKLVQCLDKNEKAMMSQKYIEFYVHAISQENENNDEKLSIYISALSYLSNSYLIDPNIIELSTQIIENAKTQQIVLQNDYALSLLFKAIPKIGKTYLFHTYNQIFTNCKGPISLKSICSQLKTVLTPQNIEWFPPIIEHLYQVTLSLINDYLVKVNFGVKMVNLEMSFKEFFDFVIVFLNSSLKLPWNEYIGQIVKTLVPVINSLANRFYDSPIIFCCCVEFMQNLLKMHRNAEKWNQDFYNLITQTLQSFIPISINIVFNPQIDFLSKNWRYLIKNLFTFHDSFSSKFENGVELLGQQFQKFGAPPEFVQNYMKISEMSNNRIEPLVLLYHELSLYFQGLNV